MHEGLGVNHDEWVHEHNDAKEQSPDSPWSDDEHSFLDCRIMSATAKSVNAFPHCTLYKI
jgi:hypothetical protein